MILIVIILDRLLIGGIKFVLDKVASAVDEEMNDEGRLREELLAAQMRYELGELSDDEFVELEADILDRLREIREREREEAGGAGAMSFQPGEYGVDVSFNAGNAGDAGDEEDEP
jgi:hypothetical protein